MISSSSSIRVHINVITTKCCTMFFLTIAVFILQYLRNLDPNSAYYDPKTRAMRENPYSNTGKIPEE